MLPLILPYAGCSKDHIESAKYMACIAYEEDIRHSQLDEVDGKLRAQVDGEMVEIDNKLFGADNNIYSEFEALDKNRLFYGVIGLIVGVATVVFAVIATFKLAIAASIISLFFIGCEINNEIKYRNTFKQLGLQEVVTVIALIKKGYEDVLKLNQKHENFLENKSDEETQEKRQKELEKYQQDWTEFMEKKENLDLFIKSHQGMRDEPDVTAFLHKSWPFFGTLEEGKVSLKF